MLGRGGGGGSAPRPRLQASFLTTATHHWSGGDRGDSAAHQGCTPTHRWRTRVLARSAWWAASWRARAHIAPTTSAVQDGRRGGGFVWVAPVTAAEKEAPFRASEHTCHSGRSSRRLRNAFASNSLRSSKRSAFGSKLANALASTSDKSLTRCE
eukprot:scaffold98698_cov29-Tisochrysis_lutea.AAC.3